MDVIGQIDTTAGPQFVVEFDERETVRVAPQEDGTHWISPVMSHDNVRAMMGDWGPVTDTDAAERAVKAVRRDARHRIDLRMTPDQRAAVRSDTWTWAGVFHSQGTYDHSPRKANLEIALQALEAAGKPRGPYTTADAEWAKRVVEDVLIRTGMEPRATDIILGLETGVDVDTDTSLDPIEPQGDSS